MVAMAVRRKKSAVKSPPPGIFEKMSGMVLKRRPGPPAGVPPKAKTAGKMARPASSDTAVSASATRAALGTMRVPSGRYDP